MKDFPPKAFQVHGLDVLSEVVSIEDTQDGAKAFRVRSSCGSHSQTNVMTAYCSNPAYSEEKLLAGLENFRHQMAEETAKNHLGIAAPPLKYLSVRLARPGIDKWSSWMLSTVDVRSPVTRVMREVVEVLQLPVSKQEALTIAPDGQQVRVPLHEATIQVGGKTLQIDVLPVEMNLPCILGADLIEESIQDVDELYDLFMDEFSRSLRNVARGKKKTVVIVGPYGKNLDRLRKIQNELPALGYHGVVLQDFPDIKEQSLAEKMLLFGSISRFVLCDDSSPSGHIQELKACADAGFVTAILRPEGKPATWVQADIAQGRDYVREFPYSESTLVASVKAAVEWAEQKVQERAAAYDKLYQWRNPNVRLA